MGLAQRSALLLLLPAAAFAAGAAEQPPTLLLTITGWLSLHPLLAPLLFILLYGVVVMLFLPGTLLCLAGGALFGVWFGTLLNVTGATVGACCAFLTARHLAAQMVERHMSGTLQQLKQGVEAEGWRFVAMVRLLPMVPYDLSSYAFGLSRIPLGQFAAANALCLLPRLFVYTYIGHSGMALLEEDGDRMLNLVTLLTLLLAFFLLPHLYHRLRRKN
jgi:uncharacterized membrane protein YdjX (TVP38/TMEM64 family)